MELAVVGLGKLGGPLALLLAEAGHHVTGIDADEIRVKEWWAEGCAPHYEPGLTGLLAEVGDRIAWSTEVADAAEAEMTFIVVPTPSKADDSFDASAVCDVVGCLGAALGRVDHTVVVVSTLSPGSTDGEVRRALERATEREVGDGLALCYSPQFIALGDVIAGMRDPALVLVGGDVEPAAKVREVLGSILQSPGLPGGRRAGQSVRRPVLLTNTEAELAKIGVNAYLTMKMSFANTLGEMSEGYKARGYLVAGAIGSDPRIGGAYLKPGRPYGGPCFPRDTLAFARAAREVEAFHALADAVHATNRQQGDRWFHRLLDLTRPSQIVAVLGLAYKPGTDVTTESFGLRLATQLQSHGREVHAFDPLVAHADGLPTYPDAASAVRDADVVVLANDDPAFVGPFPGKVIVDCMGTNVDIEGAAAYHRVGDGT